ncbi:MAG: hypothetical protein ACTSXD_07115 [Candidatus Heimdallarchaeaceae archaeon]
MGIKRFLNNLRFKFKKKDRILTDINEEEIKKDKTLREQQKYIQSLEAQLSHKSAKERTKKIDERNLQEDLTLIKELELEQKKIEEENYYGSYNLANLFKNLQKKKYKIDITDSSDKVIFDKLKTIRVLNNGTLAIQGKSGQIWSEGSNMRDLIFKPESFKNQIRRKRLMMPYDENFNRTIDLNELEEGEISYNPQENKWNIGEEKRKKVIYMIMERDRMIHDLREDKKHKEQLISDLRNKVQDLELAKESWKHQANNSQKELSIALQNEQLMSSQLNNVDRQFMIAMEQNLLLEQIKNKYENAFDEIAEEIEDEKSRTKIKKAKLDVWSDIKRAIKMTPKKETTIETKQLAEEVEENA